MTPTITDHTLHIGEYTEPLPHLPQAATVRAWAVPTEYRASGYFVSVQPLGQPVELPACDASVTQLLATLELPASAAAQLQFARDERKAAINADADRMIAALSSAYPASEVISWDQQVREAAAYAADSAAATPLLAALSAARGVAIADLAQRVQARALAFSAESGRILGARQRLDDQLGSATTTDEVAAVPSLASLLAELPLPA